MRVLIALAWLGLAACGSEPAPGGAADEPRDETVFDPLTDTLERAESVQETLDRRAAEQRRRIEEGR